MTSLGQLQRMHARHVTSGLMDHLACRLTGLSLTPHRTVLTRRGYARLARARPRTPSTSSTANTLSESSSSSASSTKSRVGSTAGKSMPNIKLPGRFAQPETTPQYDPNMIIFLDKSGKVTMIPHDDRVVTHAPIEHEEASSVDGDEPHFQRGSKEMEYGRKRIGQVDLPVPVQDAIRDIILDHDKSMIRADALRLYGSLRSTGALDGDEYEELAVKRIKSESDINKGDKAVPAHILEYGHRESTAYIAAVAPTTYGAIKNVLEEVNKRVPDLKAKTFLDFGTGPGTAIWAANEVWGGSMTYAGVDVSAGMLDTAERILATMSSNGSDIPNVNLKLFTSYGTHATKHDIVMSAFTLSEITAPALRRATLENLWESTNDILILVDRGTPNGFRVLAEAREQILGLDAYRFKKKPTFDAYGNQLPEEELPTREPGHVLAPCPHDGVCPIFVSLSRTSPWCHFSQKVQRPDFLRKTKHSKENFEDSKYTYVVLRKGARPVFHPPAATPSIPLDPSLIPSQLSESTDDTPESSSDPSAPKRRAKHKKPPPPPPVAYDNHEDMFSASHSWSRIVIPPLKKDGHVVIDTCAANGYLERIVIPRSQGKIPYRDARKAMWGDLFPHAPKNKPVRRELVANGRSEGELVVEEKEEGSDTRKARPSISPQRLLKRTKQKEKKRSRQKISLENHDETRQRQTGKKGRDNNLLLEL